MQIVFHSTCLNIAGSIYQSLSTVHQSQMNNRAQKHSQVMMNLYFYAMLRSASCLHHCSYTNRHVSGQLHTAVLTTPPVAVTAVVTAVHHHTNICLCLILCPYTMHLNKYFRSAHIQFLLLLLTAVILSMYLHEQNFRNERFTALCDKYWLTLAPPNYYWGKY